MYVHESEDEEKEIDDEIAEKTDRWMQLAELI